MVKRSVLLILIAFLISSCGVGFKYTTLNHAGHIDGIYSSNDIKIDTLNEFQVRNKLRTDFQFRYNFAQYALSQPTSFDWNNRILGNRYNWNRPYYGYYWNRTQMWHDWVWGYPYFTPHRWSPFGYDRWGYGIHYGWNNHGWRYNRYYNNGWNNYGWSNLYGYRGRVNYRPNYNRRNNSNFVIEEDGVRWYSSSSDNTNRRTNYNKRVIRNSNDKTINNNPRGYSRPESNNNGGRSRIRENIPTQPVRTRQPNTIQPRQIRGGQRPPVLQQTRTSSQSNVKGRNGSSRGKN